MYMLSKNMATINIPKNASKTLEEAVERSYPGDPWIKRWRNPSSPPRTLCSRPKHLGWTAIHHSKDCFILKIFIVSWNLLASTESLHFETKASNVGRSPMWRTILGLILFVRNMPRTIKLFLIKILSVFSFNYDF